MKISASVNIGRPTTDSSVDRPVDRRRPGPSTDVGAQNKPTSKPTSVDRPPAWRSTARSTDAYQVCRPMYTHQKPHSLVSVGRPPGRPSPKASVDRHPGRISALIRNLHEWPIRPKHTLKPRENLHGARGARVTRPGTPRVSCQTRMHQITKPNTEKLDFSHKTANEQKR